MKIYEKERQLGLDKKILSKASSLAVASVQTSKADDNFQAIAAKLYNKYQKEWMDKYISPDTMLVNAILVTSDWNGNDDVFVADDMWKARYSPVYKPVNMNHEGREGTENRTIGVICSASAVDDKYENIYLDESSKIPDTFHILVSAYIWEKYWPEQTKEIKDKIAKGEQFVSMECLFDDFGYALRKEGDKECMLLPRNEITAWMTESLRAYDGKGKVKVNGTEYQVGRWLRNYIFSGMGFVGHPANAKSIVFEDYVSKNAVATASMKQVKAEEIKQWSEPQAEKFEVLEINGVCMMKGQVYYGSN